MASARKEGFSAGQAASGKATTTVVGSSAPSTELVQTKVKEIMNQAYRTLSVKFSTEPSYLKEDISKILSSTIRVGLTCTEIDCNEGSSFVCT